MQTTTNYMDELNDSQREAVLYVDGPSLVIAGAGSGKTRVLTYKIAYLLEQGYHPSSILALTFTNKAAREMKDRIAKLVGWEQARYLWMGTFHSIFSRILRKEAEAIGFTSNFTIYDQSDSRSLIKAIIKEMGLDDKVYKLASVQARISNAKNHLILPQAYASDAELFRADQTARMSRVRDIYLRYWERCRQAEVMDFDDLLLYTFLLFDQNPEICRKYAERFEYVLVDEYQDTNFAQHRIVWQLTSERQRVCVVGDDAQSIYSFRGANIDNILKFTRQYQDARLFKLEQNYRSTQNIVNAANSLIEKNQEQIRKEVFSENEQGERIKVFSAYSDVEEGEIVANKIVELRRKEKMTYSDFAILYRTNAQSRIFEEALRKRSLLYRIYGGLSFYQRKEIKDVIAYFRLVVNPNDEEAFKRIINYPARGIGDTTVNKIIAAATEANVSLWTVLCDVEHYGLPVNKSTRNKLEAFRQLIADFSGHVVIADAYELGQDIVRRSGIFSEIYQDRTPENLARQENIAELVNGIHDFCESRREEGDERIYLPDFLSEVSLLSDQDTDDSDSDDKITLMTVHSAKGLEFHTVFVVGLEEDLFPSALAKNSLRELEEERRLFYVAITRAEKHCFLSFARSRFRYGHMEFGNPSCFLRDIDSKYLELSQGMQSSYRAVFPIRKPSEETRLQHSNSFKQAGEKNLRPIEGTLQEKAVIKENASSPKNTFGVCVGQSIEHERFGFGEVINVEGTGENCKATVRFRNAGVKQLLLKFARFKVVK